ncbi:hypothetical protein MMPV_003298 [Pyropia vietnamensis]
MAVAAVMGVTLLVLWLITRSGSGGDYLLVHPGEAARARFGATVGAAVAGMASAAAAALSARGGGPAASVAAAGLLRRWPLPPPACGRSVVTVETKFNGFGAQLLRRAAALSVAASRSAVLVAAPARWWNYGCGLYRGWDCYFVPPVKSCVADEVGELPLAVGALAAVGGVGAVGGDGSGGGGHAGGAGGAASAATSAAAAAAAAINVSACESLSALGPDAEGVACVKVATDADQQVAAATLTAGSSDRGMAAAGDALAALTHPTPAFAAAVDAAASHARRRLHGGRYIGVHLRRGDKATEVPSVPLAAYARAVFVLAVSVGGPVMDPRRAVPVTRVYIASDDAAAVGALAALLPAMTVVSTASGSGHKQAALNAAPAAATAAAVAALWADVTLLVGAVGFVGSGSSNLGRVVQLLRLARGAPLASSVSVDTRWGGGVAWQDFGVGYCQGVGVNEVVCRGQRRTEE